MLTRKGLDTFCRVAEYDLEVMRLAVSYARLHISSRSEYTPTTLINMFTWGDTEQGHGWWRDHHQRMLEGGYYA